MQPRQGQIRPNSAKRRSMRVDCTVPSRYLGHYCLIMARTFRIFPLFLATLFVACTDIPIVDTRPNPEPPALPAPAMECPPVVNVVADKMNVLYVGVDNPISLEVENVSFQSLKILVSGGKTVFQGSDGKYLVRPYEADEVRVLVLNEVGLRVAKKIFRAKPMPDPVASLGNLSPGDVSLGTFQAARKLNATIPNFDLDLRCAVTGFEVRRIKPEGEVVRLENKGSVYGDLTASAMLQGEIGDLVLYTNIRARCPGDAASRRLNSLVFTLR
jgi:hypothetical protein